MKWTRHTLWTVLLLCACGQGEAPGEPDAWMDGVAGTYAMDARRTLAGMNLTDEEGNTLELTDENIAARQAAYGLGTMHIELRADGTFQLVSGTGEHEFRTAGTWQETGGSIEMVTKTVNGEPAPSEARIVERFRVERGYLIGEQDDLRVYLAKQPPAGR
jgi:hypothetical protein